MSYTEQIISSEVHYLIKVINNLLKKNNVPKIVSVNSNVEYSIIDDTFKIYMQYLVTSEETNVTNVVFTTISTAEKNIFYATEEEVISNLNNVFFGEILLHTNFNTRIEVGDLLANPCQN